MGKISTYTAATAMTDDDVVLGNDGSTTKTFTGTVARTYMQLPPAFASGTALNTAIGDLAAAGGGVIRLPPGTIPLGSTTLLFNTTARLKVSLIGASQGATILTYDGTSHAIEYGDPTATSALPGAMNVLSDFTVTSAGTDRRAGSIGIKVCKSLFPCIERVAVERLELGFKWDGSDQWIASGAMYHCRTNQVLNGLLITADSGKQVNHTNIYGCYFYGGIGRTSNSYGVRVEAAADSNSFFATAVEEFDKGFWLRSTPGASATRLFAPRAEACNTLYLRDSGSRNNAILFPFGGNTTEFDASSWEADGVPSYNTYISDEMTFFNKATLPAASASYRGQIFRVTGGAGVADRHVICTKNASDAYGWRDLY